jgi:hypothetical protein
MALLAKQDPLAAVAFTRKNIVKNNIEHKLQDFISKLLT